MSSTVVVVAFEIIEFSSQVARIPKRGLIQVFAPYGADNPFDERAGYGGIGNRLDFSNIQYSQVGLPAVALE